MVLVDPASISVAGIGNTDGCVRGCVRREPVVVASKIASKMALIMAEHSSAGHVCYYEYNCKLKATAEGKRWLALHTSSQIEY